MEINALHDTPEALSVLTAASAFAALGAEIRLSILRVLVRAGPEGLPVGQIQSQLGLAGSTLSHHIRALCDAGLIAQTRSGRILNCRADYDHIAALAQFLMSECCVDAAATQETEKIKGVTP